MLNNLVKQSLVLGVCLGLAACGSNSDSDAGNGVYAYISAEATGDGNTTVSALMLNGSKGSGQVIDIAPGNLMVNAFTVGGVVTASMGLVDNSPYQDTYDTAPINDDDPDTVFETVYVSAPSSTVSLPGGFTLDDTQTTGTAFQVSWADTNFSWAWTNDDIAYAGGATFTIYYRVFCPSNGLLQPTISNGSVALDSEISLTVPMSVIEASVVWGVAPNKAVDTCDLDVTLERSIPGVLDVNYSGGAITGMQTRSQTFTIVP